MQGKYRLIADPNVTEYLNPRVIVNIDGEYPTTIKISLPFSRRVGKVLVRQELLIKIEEDWKDDPKVKLCLNLLKEVIE